jgi:hypothetical protein
MNSPGFRHIRSVSEVDLEKITWIVEECENQDKEKIEEIDSKTIKMKKLLHNVQKHNDWILDFE